MRQISIRTAAQACGGLTLKNLGNGMLEANSQSIVDLSNKPTINERVSSYIDEYGKVHHKYQNIPNLQYRGNLVETTEGIFTNCFTGSFSVAAGLILTIFSIKKSFSL